VSRSKRENAMRQVRSLVVKLGTQVLADEQGRLDCSLIERIADEVHALTKSGRHVAIVSSGAIGAGMGDLGLAKRPTALPQLQACAAVGQAHLARAFDEALKRHGRAAAQVLLTRSDVEDRTRYLNIRNCIGALERYGAVPVINENDTVSVDEIRFGDNDILAAMVTNLLRADLLVLLTTAEGVYRDAAGRERFDVVENMEEVQEAVLPEARTPLGVGGMVSKLQAAATVLAAGEMAAIANGRRENVLRDLLAGEPVGTLFLPKTGKMAARQRWIGLARRPRGKIRVDAGAAKAVRARKSLLASGITTVEGRFARGDVVAVVGPDGEEIAQGLANYDASDVEKIKGLRSSQFSKVLGESAGGYDEVIHADNLVVME